MSHDSLRIRPRPGRMVAVSLAAVGLAGSAAVVAQDPLPPPGGFAIARSLDQLTTWSDRYRTRMDAYYPDPGSVPAPATGWPAVLVIHGKGGRRSNAIIVRRCEYLAKRGYVSLAYDVRGDGDTVALNPGQGTGSSSRRILDVAEAYFVAERTLRGLMDDARLGITGWSMGAGFSLDAASFSGQTLPNSASGYVQQMPVLSAAIPDINVLDRPEDYVPGSVMFQTRAALRIYQRSSTSQLARAIVAGSYAQLRQYYEQDPVQARTVRLRQSDVPLLVCYSFGDQFHFLNQNIDGLQALKATTPKRLYVSSGGHGTPTNDLEDANEQDLVGRWCDRFLKGRSNDADRGPAVEFAVPPTAFTTWNDRRSAWQHRLLAGLRDPSPAATLYLRAGTGRVGQLSSSAPGAAEGPFVIAHRVQSGYTAGSFLADGAAPRRVLQAVPWQQVAFDLAATATERELTGRVKLSFDVQTARSNLQLSASLLDLDPQGNSRWITSGFAAQRGARPGTQRFEIEFEETPYLLPAGHRLRLTIHNLPARPNGTAAHFLYIPEFENEDYRIVTGPSSSAKLELRLRSAGMPSLRPRFAEVSAAAPIQHRFQIDGHESRANADYALLLGISGIAPPITSPVFAWFVPDGLTVGGVTLLNTAVLPNGAGRLDASGAANASFVLTDPGLRRVSPGLRLQFLAVGTDRSGTPFASNPATLVIRP